MSPNSVLLQCAPTRRHRAALWTIVLSTLALCNRPAGAAPGTVPVDAAAAALRVQRDPVTGTLTPAGPTAEPMLMPLWSATMRPALDRLPVVRMSNGTRMVDLTGIYLDFATAHREWNGRVVTGCDDAWVPDVLRALAIPERPATAPLGWAER